MDDEMRRCMGSYSPNLADLKNNPVVEMGAVNYLYGLTEDLRVCLSYVFPECWKVIYTVAMLRAIYRDNARFCKLQRLYKRSYLSQLSKNVPYSSAGYIVDKRPEGPAVITKKQGLALLRMRGFIFKEDIDPNTGEILTPSA